MKICGKCSTKNNDEAFHCTQCGEKLPLMSMEGISIANHLYTGFTLNSDSVMSVWILAIIIGVIEIIIANLVTSGSITMPAEEAMNVYMPIGFAVGYTLCIVYGFLLLRNAEPSCYFLEML